MFARTHRAYYLASNPFRSCAHAQSSYCSTTQMINLQHTDAVHRLMSKRLDPVVVPVSGLLRPSRVLRCPVSPPTTDTSSIQQDRGGSDEVEQLLSTPCMLTEELAERLIAAAELAASRTDSGLDLTGRTLDAKVNGSYVKYGWFHSQACFFLDPCAALNTVAMCHCLKQLEWRNRMKCGTWMMSCPVQQCEKFESYRLLEHVASYIADQLLAQVPAGLSFDDWVCSCAPNFRLEVLLLISEAERYKYFLCLLDGGCQYYSRELQRFVNKSLRRKLKEQEMCADISVFLFVRGTGIESSLVINESSLPRFTVAVTYEKRGKLK